MFMSIAWASNGGNIALLACAGPMGIGAIDYAINGGIQPSRVVVVDIDDKRPGAGAEAAAGGSGGQ